MDWDLGDQEAIRGLSRDARALHYISLGYTRDVASFMAENIDRMARFKRTHHIKSMTVDVDWQAAKFTVEIDYHNVIALE